MGVSTIRTYPNENWVRAYDWQGRRQGSEPAVYRVETWEVPPFWWLMRIIRRGVRT